MLTRSFHNLLMPPDTFERHSIVAAHASDARTVLDVGGNSGELAGFLPDADVTAINLSGEKADSHFDGDRIPFPDSSFDLVVSLDVLEHIPAERRSRHIRELSRVARKQVILCCPLGSFEHVEAERELASWYQEVAGASHRFLEEHLEIGLPTESEVRQLLEELDEHYEMAFHGDFRKANAAFRKSTMLRHCPGPRTALSYARLRLDPRRSLTTAPQSSPWSNRMFVEITVAPEPLPST